MTPDHTTQSKPLLHNFKLTISLLVSTLRIINRGEQISSDLHTNFVQSRADSTAQTRAQRAQTRAGAYKRGHPRARKRAGGRERGTPLSLPQPETGEGANDSGDDDTTM